jgi:FKBP-type peptidyl-prolyl cis-trans isomerase
VCRKISALLMLLLMVAGCGTTTAAAPAKAPTASLADITVHGSAKSEPTVKFNAPLRFSTLQRKIVIHGPGKGPAVKPSSVVTVNYVGINASDGAVFDSSWRSGKPATFALSQVIPGLSKGLVGTHAGDRVLVGIPSKEAFDPTGNGSTVHQGDSVVMVVDVRKVATPLTEATGTKQPVPRTVPRLTYDNAGHPAKFVATPQTPKTVSKLGVYPIIKGHGPVVKSGQTLTVQYVGQIYPDGTVFDSSWSRSQPITFPVGTGQVIPGWDKGLVGQRVGSRVILVIPSALGYGSSGSGNIPPNADLIFAVDILQAS